MTSGARLIAPTGALLVVDLQLRLLPKTWRPDRVTTNAHRLIQGARLLNVPVFATEQYPKGLGPTVPELADLLPVRSPKMTFHALTAPGVSEGLLVPSVEHVTLCGIEAHVCVAQTALELLSHGKLPVVVADATSSRVPYDWEIALRRLERAGCVVTTTEAVLFEWAETADRPEFKAISALVTGAGPPLPTNNSSEAQT